MGKLESVRQALLALRASKLRAFLTMLGVIIGISAMMVMVALVHGFQTIVKRQFESLGSRLIIVGFQPRENRPGARQTFDALRIDDVRAIRGECDLLSNVSAENEMGGLIAAHNEVEHNTRTIGVEPQYLELRGLKVAAGRFIEDRDLDAWSAVSVLGRETAARLFGAADPIGADITVSGVRLAVVGVLARKGRTFDDNNDDRIYVPLTTAQKRMTGYDRVNVIFAQARDPERTTAAMDQIWRLLMRRHDNRPDFLVDSQSRILAVLDTIMVGLGAGLAGIAGLALLVGGIGIMNIMLVSVTERTREIGIRKAVGAKRHDILWQFLIEAMTLSGIGGLIGVAAGQGMAAIVAAVAKDRLPASVPPWAAALAFAFSLLVGIVSGVYPAFRAARLDPIEALRHE
jgi:putative ABC transport system permease protein